MPSFNVSKSKTVIFLATISLVAFSVFFHTITAAGPASTPPVGSGSFIDGYQGGLGEMISIGGPIDESLLIRFSSLLIYSDPSPSSPVNYNLNVKDKDSNDLLRVTTSGIVVVGTTTLSNDSNYKLQTNTLKANFYASNYASIPGGETPANEGLCAPTPTIPFCKVGIDIVGTTTITSTLRGDYDNSVGSFYAKISGFDSISAGSIFFSGNLNASKISSGTFASSSNYAFPNSLGVSTSSTSTLPANLSVYGAGLTSSGYFSTSTYLKIDPTAISNPGMLNVTSSRGSWFSSFNKGIRLEGNSSVEFGGGTNGTLYGISASSSRLYIFNTNTELNSNLSPNFYNLTISTSSVGIGIGQNNPSSHLHVSGTLIIDGTNGFRLGTSATSNYVLVASATGTASWAQAAAGITGNTVNETARYNTSTWIGSSLLFNNSTTMIGVGTTDISASGLTLLRVGSGGYLQVGNFSTTGDPVTADCNSDTEKGRIGVDTFSTGELHICMGASGWKQSPAFWYDTAWRYRKKITIDRTKVAGSLVNFPMLVSSTDSGLQLSAQADGDDILFTRSNGITKIAHEIENYDSATGNLTAWVFISSLPTSADTEIYMYYGNPNASNQQDATNVWKDIYRGVWHLKESSGNFADSSPSPESDCSYSNTGMRVGPIGAPITAVGAKINTGQLFAGTYTNSCTSLNGHCIDISQPAGTSNPSCTGFNDANTTYSAWVKIYNLNQIGGLKGIIGRRTGNDVYHILYDADNLDEKFGFYVRKDGSPFNSLTGDYWQSVISPTSVATTSLWYHVAFTNTAAGILTGYINGISIGSVTDATPNALTEISNVRIGNDGSTYIEATIDEVRIARIAYPPEWIQTEYNNQSSPSTFYSIGPQE